MRAERRLGEMIRAQKASVGLATGGQPYQATGANGERVGRAPTLADAGIDKKLSSRAHIPGAKASLLFGDIILAVPIYLM